MCFNLPLTSLGEHQKAPKQIAKPISKWLVAIPNIIGVVTAIPIKTAFEKLVLLKNSNNSLACFRIKVKMRFYIL
ncbi:hypothetical protein GCM10022292_22270 [Winogradskyella damuponensis]|uniref:Uncharacterized protein n=1 Tax=Winogradskyella damuponensis TaxID=943939 RepID=A0ABP8CXP2_9FLAO